MSGDTLTKTIDSGTLAALEAEFAAVAMLVEIDTSPALRYCSPYPDPIVDGGNTYLPRFVELEVLRWGTVSRAGCTVVIDNRDDAISDVSYTTHLSDGYTLAVSILAKATWFDAWEAVYPSFSGLISQVSGNAESVRISAAASVGLNANSAHPPMDMYCPYPRDGSFKGSRCGYAGAGTSCDGSWAQCTTYANTARFGGHRFAPKPGTVWRIGVNSGMQTVPAHHTGGNPPPGQDGQTHQSSPWLPTGDTGADDQGGRPPRGTQGRY